MTKDEALKLALEALEHMCHHTRAKAGYKGKIVEAAMSAAEEALAQPEQKPVAWKTDDVELYVREDKFGFYNIPLYTTPPQRKPLTDEEIDALWLQHDFIRAPDRKRQAFARAIEAAHGIKGEA